MRNNIVGLFEKIILDMTSIRPLPDLEVRARNIDDLNNEYIKRTDNQLPPYLISILTDWYLLEVLLDKNVDKVTKTEHPILSARQIKRRVLRESTMEGDVIDFLQQKCIKRQNSLRKTIHKEVM